MSIKLPDNLKVSPNPAARRSTFNLPDGVHNIIEELAKGLRMSMKDLFSDLVLYVGPGLTSVESQGPKSRKTYVLAPDTLKKLHSYAQRSAISRDDLITALVYKLVEHINEIANKLSYEKKIEAAKRIQDCAEKALAEWDKCSEERELLEKYDTEFHAVAEYLGYIDQLNELPSYLDNYIDKVREAQHEDDETRG